MKKREKAKGSKNEEKSGSIKNTQAFYIFQYSLLAKVLLEKFSHCNMVADIDLPVGTVVQRVKSLLSQGDVITGGTAGGSKNSGTGVGDLYPGLYRGEGYQHGHEQLQLSCHEYPEAENSVYDIFKELAAEVLRCGV